MAGARFNPSAFFKFVQYCTQTLALAIKYRLELGIFATSTES
jgi:hypothetical protein